jgi:hypothetical protein
MNKKSHCEVLPAKKYYGKYATGTVLLVNGSVEFHGDRKDVDKLLKGIREREGITKYKAIAIKNKTAYLPAIRIIDGTIKRTIKIRSKNSFLGYKSKDSAILHAEKDIESNNFCDYR